MREESCAGTKPSVPFQSETVSLQLVRVASWRVILPPPVLPAVPKLRVVAWMES